MKIGIFGGSFNPIHVGHVALAKAILEQCGLDEVWLMVSPQNPLKQQADLLDDGARFEMAQLAVRDVEGVKAIDYQAKDEIGGLAMDIASKVVEKEIREEDHRKLIDEFINKVGEAS